ncbi:hypothetical protein RGQ21_29630 [Kitasatospora aureofaciens]|nr:hypothetical protein RGQ21_29630 [Kitasatospora aureofaciens]
MSKGRVRRTPLCGDPARAGLPRAPGCEELLERGETPYVTGLRDDFAGQG